jgi:DUF4097 and DUF4098 domain-containing protein YvlB
MTVEDVREYERKMQEETNLKVLSKAEEDEQEKEEDEKDGPVSGDKEGSVTSPTTAKSTELPSPSASAAAGPEVANPAASITGGIRSWLTWS